MPEFDDSWSRIAAYGALLAVVLANICGNILIKMGAINSAKAFAFWGVLTWHSLAGIICFAFSIIIYAWSLKIVPLHIAQTISSAQFALAFVAASIVFGDEISLRQWAGAVVVLVGIVIATI